MYFTSLTSSFIKINMTYTILYKDIPRGENIIARDTLCVIATAWESDVFQPDDEILIIDWAYIYNS